MSQKKEEPEQIREKVFQKIKGGEVKMKPSCFFVAVSWFWVFVAVALFFFAAAILSVVIRYVDFAEPGAMLVHKPFFFLFSLPYFLIAMFIFLLVFSALAYRKSRNCCRHENWMLLGMLFLGAVTLGFSVYDAHLEAKVAEKIEKSRRINSFVLTPEEFWYQPEKGTLSGVVSERISEDSIRLQSHDGVFWRVVSIKKIQPELARRKAFVKMLGERQGEYLFVAQEVFPW